MNILNNNLANIYRPNFKAKISEKEINSIYSAKQYFSDCYLVSSLEALSHTKNGRKIIQENIQIDDNLPNIINCYLYNPNGEKEIYKIPMDSATKGYEKLYKHQSNKILRSLDVSVSQYENKYKTKPLICRIFDNLKSYNFEYNLPSNFMKHFTGKNPIAVGETDFNINLQNYKDTLIPLFERMNKEKEFSFVISNGMKRYNSRYWHVYIIENVDMKNKTITVKEKHNNKSETMPIEKALKTFKFITGYFNSDLEKTTKI